ncbi:hypothetical protein MCOR02_011618 [Pyricularia oryzae]|uniref:FAD dependent oxidoreductase domain-containing protein n=1 Tax=Pyricularia oryzae TaxID=318829 RepID=A0A4P7N620_PYROR|nr:hypothetical protein MCOR02_011618 [Pyricularia oryzae]KAI6317237.1 hypothetical protein MCOR34_004045 [Pyricularia oryzae]KAI6476244.1 hypothetical protein MCOR17_001162 [Pyricularia oryzae]KAI6499641.1 hypothetical protein MCOR13_006215 [Pyricularia oryzae]KAI6599405.1 hypothetical protein MCOR04_002419 [Pyricularia oryzae]
MDSKPRHIVIIGGGVIGCTTAYFLTRHEKYDPAIHKITIIEAAGIASSASGKAGGLLGLWANRAVETVPLSFKLHEKLANEHDGEERWGYRKLQGCGTIDTKLKVDDLPDKERAAFPKSSAKTKGAKRQKLNQASRTPPQTPDKSPQTPAFRLLASEKPSLPDPGAPGETLQGTNPNHAAETQLASPIEQALELPGLPKDSSEPQSEHPDTALNIRPTEDTCVRPQRELAACITGTSTRWKSHTILPNGDYFIGDTAIASNKISEGHFPKQSLESQTGGLEDTLQHDSIMNNGEVLSSEDKAINSKVTPLAMTSEPQADLNGDDLPERREKRVNCLQPKKEDKYKTVLDQIGDQLPIANPATARELRSTRSVSSRQNSATLHGSDTAPATKTAITNGNANPPRRSGRQRTGTDKPLNKPSTGNGGATNNVPPKPASITPTVESVKQAVPVKGRGRGGRKDRTGKFPNSCVFPPDLTWINQDLVSSYKKQGAGDSNDTAQVHPYHFTHCMAKLAEGRGVCIRQGVMVTAIDYDHGKGVHGVEILERNSNRRSTLGDDVTDVMVAAGSWTSTLLPKTEIGGVRAHSVVWEVDVTPHAVFTNINLPRGYIPSHRLSRGEVVKASKKLVSSDPEAYARPFKEVYACGAVDHEVELPPTADLVMVDERHCDDIITWLSLVSPVLADAAVKHKQACYMPLREGGDEEPMFGRTLTPGLWLAAGHSCWGIQNAPACGLLMAEMLMDGKTSSLDENVIAAYDPRRFGV